jgi:ABC-2 type transport system ATP-binding protein
MEYDDVLALDDLTLSVERGAAFGFLGPNGSGKTTTIDVLTGQRTPTAGSARVLDIDPVADPVGVREQVGIVPEGEHPPSFMTPREYFQFVADVRDVDGVEDRIEEWADRLLFADTLDTLTTDLSKGQRQKVMLTQAFLHEPDLVFIDEPLVNLDPLIQERVKDFFREYHGAGNTLFLSTHFIEVAADVCDRVAVIADGRLEARVGPEELSTERLLDLFADRFAATPSGPKTPASTEATED